MPTMTISVSEQMKDFVAGIIEDGTYSNASEVFRDGLRIIQEKQLRLQALRSHIDEAILQGGSNSPEEVLESVNVYLDETKDIIE